jgi:hypothetical protein
MYPLKRLQRVLAVAAAIAAGACGAISPVGERGDVDALLRDGAGYVDLLRNTPTPALSDADILALGYLERARLGLGSPFRLIDFALNDPQLDSIQRQRIAYAVLGLVLDGDVYRVDPVVLESVGFFAVASGTRAGAAQLALIERTIASASTAASGERAVRLGYQLADAERAVTSVPHFAVSQAAALIADRRRAGEDARRLLRAAESAGRDPLAILREWRLDRRFQVERPALAALSVGEEASIALAGPRFATSLRALSLRLISQPLRTAQPDGTDGSEGFLTFEAATRLLDLAAERNYPAQAPVAVAVDIARGGLLARPGLTAAQLDARAAFAADAWNEERLVGASVRLQHLDDAGGHRLPLIILRAAAFLRAWGQEEPWFPGDPAPAARDLIARFGFESVEFGDDVPETWRSYYLRSLGHALADIQRVVPTIALRGLNVRIAPLADSRVALALHDPSTRTVHLPPRSGAGTIAHEIAHDLDWQLARKRYSIRGGYATDLAVRNGRGDRIASSLGGLATAFRPPAVEGVEIDSHDSRPAEVFARGTDWFVASALAREGRTGGYLTSFQDAAITGYGSTRGPHIGGRAVPSLLGILDAIAPVQNEVREWAIEEYGPERNLSPLELAGAILGTAAASAYDARMEGIATARDQAMSAVSAPACRLTSADGMRRLVEAQRVLIERSTTAAARGAAIDQIRDLASTQPQLSAAATENWLAWRLYGAPEPADSALTELAPAFEDLLTRSAILSNPPVAPRGVGGWLAAPTSICGGNPFAERSSGTDVVWKAGGAGIATEKAGSGISGSRHLQLEEGPE